MAELLNPDWVHLPDLLELPVDGNCPELGIVEALLRAQQHQAEVALGGDSTHSLWFLVTDGPNAAHYEIHNDADEPRHEVHYEYFEDEPEHGYTIHRGN